MPDAKLKYQQLLSYGKKLPPMPQEDHTDENKVRGCVSQVQSRPLQDMKQSSRVLNCSIWPVLDYQQAKYSACQGLVRQPPAHLTLLMRLQVWVKPQVRDGKIYWLADSDSALTKVLRCCSCKVAHPLPQSF